MLDAAVNRFLEGGVQPLFFPERKLSLNVNLQPSTVYPRGTLLVPGGAAQSDVQTLTITATGGNYTLSVTIDGETQTTSALAYNASAATIQAALAGLGIVGSGDVTVSGTGPYTITFGGLLANMPVAPITVTTTALTGGSASVAHTTTGQTAGAFSAYAGSGSPVAVLRYDCATDASGRITYGLQASGGFWGEMEKAAPAWFNGEFASGDLVALDSGAVTALGAKFISGSLSAGGILRIP